jgi:hypothetical protein
MVEELEKTYYLGVTRYGASAMLRPNPGNIGSVEPLAPVDKLCWHDVAKPVLAAS